MAGPDDGRPGNPLSASPAADFERARRDALFEPAQFDPGQFEPPPPEEIDAGAKWAALQDAAALVAMLAGLEPDPPSDAIRAFPGALRDAAAWRRETAEKGIDDLAAIMEPGIAALLAVNARGADTRAAATALWREFDAARAALLALAPPAGLASTRLDG